MQLDTTAKEYTNMMGVPLISAEREREREEQIPSRFSAFARKRIICRPTKPLVAWPLLTSFHGQQQYFFHSKIKRERVFFRSPPAYEFASSEGGGVSRRRMTCVKHGTKFLSQLGFAAVAASSATNFHINLAAEHYWPSSI
jgi:hypothetical protein